MKNQDDMTDVFSNSATSPKRPLSALFSDKKRMAIATATVLAGGSALAWGMNTAEKDTEAPPLNGFETSGGGSDSLTTDQTLPVTGGTITPTADVQIGVVNDSLNFNEAFLAARTQTGPGGVFTWHGQVYNTYQKEEWMGLSLDQRQEFLADVGFKPIPPAQAPGTTGNKTIPPPEKSEPEPIIQDMLVNGQRVIGCDIDRDGMIDVIVTPGSNGREMRILDSEGGDELDRIVVIDSYTNEVISSVKMEHPVALTNADFENQMYAIYDSLPTEQAVSKPEESSKLNDETALDVETDDANDTDEEVIPEPDYQPNADNGM